MSNDLFCKTPLIQSRQLSQLTTRKVYVKLENCQPSGSFKFRGISRSCQYALEKGCREVVTASGGNAGLSTATCARLIGLGCRVFVPKSASDGIINLIEEEGAQVEVVGNVWNEAHNHAIEICENSPESYYIHAFDDPILWSGHSTIIDEIAHDLGTTPSLLISSCGGGGLICGLIQGMRRHGWSSVPILAMETIGANSLNAAVRAGSPVKPVVLQSITSIACLGALSICQQLADYYNEGSPKVLSYVVSDREAVAACLKFADQHRMLVEPACGVSLAAIYNGLVDKLFDDNKDMFFDGPVVLIACGGSAVTLDRLYKWKCQFKL